MKYVYFLLLIFAFGCQSLEKPEKPDNLIPEEKMVDIMMDTYLSNAARSVNNRKLRSYGLKLDSIIYAKYDVDSLQFVKSNTYYAANLELYESMFKTIEERFIALKEEADSVQKKEEGQEENNKTEAEKRKDTIAEQSGLVPSIQVSQDSIE